jgi:hypothetical protein
MTCFESCSKSVSGLLKMALALKPRANMYDWAALAIVADALDLVFLFNPLYIVFVHSGSHNPRHVRRQPPPTRHRSTPGSDWPDT